MRHIVSALLVAGLLSLIPPVHAQGPGLYFNGDGAFAGFSCSSLPSGDTARTVEVWVRASDWSGAVDNHQPIFELGSEKGTGQAFGLYTEVHDGQAWLSFRGNGVDATKLAALPDTAWHFVALSYDNKVVKLYVNGSLKKSVPLSTALNTSSDTCYLGGNPGTKRFFRGSVGRIKIWNSARTAAQVDSDMVNFPCLTGEEAGLSTAFTFSEGSGAYFKSKNGSITGTLSGGTVWNKAIPSDPEPFDESIWFLIQNKAEVDTDTGIPARRQAWMIDEKGHLVIGQVPTKGNYDAFLWRAEPLGEGLSSRVLYNKSTDNKNAKGLAKRGKDLRLEVMPNRRLTYWEIEVADKGKWGTNAYTIDGPTARHNALMDMVDGRPWFAPVEANSTSQAWLLQPMEVRMGYRIPGPSTENCPFDKKLDNEYGISLHGTNVVTDWAMLNAHLIYKNEINAIKASKLTNKPFNGFNAYLISALEDDPASIADYPGHNFDSQWVEEKWGGAGTNRLFITEGVMWKKGNPHQVPTDKAYREFEQVVHEMGHSIDFRLKLNAQLAPSAGGSWEVFPLTIQQFFNERQSSKGSQGTRAELQDDEKTFLYQTFNRDNTWYPPRWMRTTQDITFELVAGDTLGPGDELHAYRGDYVFTLNIDGNAVVHRSGDFQWGSKQHLSIALEKIKTIRVSDDGKLEFLDATGKAVWTSPNDPSPDARLVVGQPTSNYNNLKLLDTKNKVLWESRRP